MSGHRLLTVCPAGGQRVPAEADGSPSAHYVEVIVGGWVDGGGIVLPRPCRAVPDE